MLSQRTGTEELEKGELAELAQQCVEDSNAWFPEVHDRSLLSQVIHHSLALGGEVGEFQNLVKKIDRGSLSLDDAATWERLEDELTDVLVYTLNIAGLLRIPIRAAYDQKRAFNQDRFGR